MVLVLAILKLLLKVLEIHRYGLLLILMMMVGKHKILVLYMSQETATDDAYQFHMGIEGVADQTYVGSFANQPFILSKNSAGCTTKNFPNSN